MLIGYLHLVAQEVRTLLASLGLRRVEDLIGRTDLVRRRNGVKAALNLDALLAPVDYHVRRERRTRDSHAPSIVSDSIGSRNPLVINGPIANTDRAFGADIAGAIAARRGDAGLPEGSVRMQMTGSAGQSFGAFALPGMRLVLIGDANDGLGKGMHGGEIVVAPTARERGRRGQVLVGNAALYGATGGRAFIGGLAGERFAVRNSGATAVVEGVGDHACEYMTGGTVVVIGRAGRNFAAGMTGGIAFLWSEAGSAAPAVDGQTLTIGTLSTDNRLQLRALLLTHERLTGSRVARAILRSDRELSGFWRIAPASIASGSAQPEDLLAVNE
jgi:glutamate synthase domain-containing protein 3